MVEQSTAAAAAVWSPAAVLKCLNNPSKFSRSGDTDGAAGGPSDHFHILIGLLSTPLLDLGDD